MRDIFLLTDYKGHFGSKHNDIPYRSGMDKKLLQRYFADRKWQTRFLKFSDVDLRTTNFKGQYVLYTSTEDPGYHYKGFIEDTVLSLEIAGAKVIPAFRYLRATNNKVFMEKIRDLLFPEQASLFNTLTFGSWEELASIIEKINYPCVIKTAEGASGDGVFLAHNRRELEKTVRKISRTSDLSSELWDIGRSFKHRGYIKDSLYRKKYIIQNFIPALKNDWKVIVFGNRYYILFRPVLPQRVFRASGAGYQNLRCGIDARIPDGIFDFAAHILKKLKIPQISLDIAYDGTRFYLFELQTMYFGTSGLIKSREYFTCQESHWIARPAVGNIEQVYVDSIVEYID